MDIAAFMSKPLDPDRDATCGRSARVIYKDQLKHAGFADAMSVEMADWLVDECVYPGQGTLRDWVRRHVEDSCSIALPVPSVKTVTVADQEEAARYPLWRPEFRAPGSSPWYTATFQLEALRIQLFGWNHIKRHCFPHIHLCKIRNKAVQLSKQSVKAARQQRSMVVEVHMPRQLATLGFKKNQDFMHMSDGSLVIKSRRCANYFMNCCTTKNIRTMCLR